MPKKKNELTAEQILERREFNRQVRMYSQSLQYTLATTRFNDETWAENETMRKRNPKVKCIYGSPHEMSHKIPVDSNVFVLEMNNTQNKIMGIGLIKNRSIPGKYIVHSNGNYNRFTYLGRRRIDRSEWSEEERCVMELIEQGCFYGIDNCKRIRGITVFKMKLQYRASLEGIHFMEYVSEMFRRRSKATSELSSN